jgi:hypothetical protein
MSKNIKINKSLLIILVLSIFFISDSVKAVSYPRPPVPRPSPPNYPHYPPPPPPPPPTYSPPAQQVVSGGCWGCPPPAPPAPTATLSASINPVLYNTEMTLTATVGNINSCTLYGGNIGTIIWFTNGTSNYLSKNITDPNTIFHLSCAGAGGQVAYDLPITIKYNSCTFNGQQIPSGSSVIAYFAPNVPAGQTCSAPSISETRTCNNGTLSGSYNYASCTVTCTYSYPPDWGACSQTTGLQTREVLSSIPIGCTGTPATSQPCIASITASIKANPATVRSGNSSIISWSSNGANSCTVTRDNNPFSSGTISSPASGITSRPISTLTTFKIKCDNSTNSTTTSVDVAIYEPPRPSLRIEPSIISWFDDTPGDSCTLSIGGEIVSTATSSIITDDNLLSGINIVLTCSGPGGEESITKPSLAPAVRSVCSPSQTYVNRETIWTAVLSTSSVSGIDTSWGGTNIPTPISAPDFSGLIFKKIYTTVGTKNIFATTTGTRLVDSLPFTAVCSTTTIMKLDAGTTGEI